MSLAHLISPLELQARQKQGSLIILDCRFALDDPAYGYNSYQQGHIPGAYFLDLESDLSGPVHPGRTGRHPLPDPQQLLTRLRECGIHQHSEIVLYDDGPGAFAAHAWWLLLWLGKHQGLYLLDGGFKAWQEAGLPLAQTTPAPATGTLQGTPNTRLTLDMPTLRQQLQQLILLDARALPRFRGEVEPIDPIAGHIPGAHCLPFTENLNADGRFLPPQTLQTRFATIVPLDKADQAVAYCGSGVTACHNLFALCLAGYPLIRLYPGSWSEWITDPQNAIALGN